MFERLFGRRKAATFRAAVDQVRAEKDPAIHIKVTGAELLDRLIGALQTQHGVHAESLLATLGSLAGFCCIDSTLKQAAASGHNPRVLGILDVVTVDGTRHYLGDPINEQLIGGKASLGAMVAETVERLGGDAVPDLPEIAAYVAASLGGPEFGHPRIAHGHQPGDLPINYVRNVWPAILPLIEAHVPVLRERVLVFGFAIQKAMEMGKDVIPPALAGQLVMECAVPMAKLDPEHLWD